MTSFSFQHFNWMGRILARAFYSNSHVKLEEALEDAGLKIYPEAYFSLVGFLFIVSIIAVVPIMIFTGLFFLAPLPLLILLLGYAIPKISAKDRGQRLDLEVPFAGTYISVMATGGLSPYASLRRLKDCDLLPNVSKVTREVEIDVQVKGLDPISAMEKSAQHLPSKEYRDLILGYASTLRTGGDVMHYLLVRTEAMFKDLAVRVKAFGERASVLMESYVTIGILMTLTITIMFMTSLSLQQFWHGSLTGDTFLLYGYIIVPLISMLFIYISDSQQLSKPLSDWRTYKVFFATMPIMGFLTLVMFLPFAAQGFAPPFAKPFIDFVSLLRSTMGLSKGYEAAIGMGITLLSGSVPAAIAHAYYMRAGRGMEHDVTRFMRDLTEARKTGASPESCVENLAGRNYGRFTQILVSANRQIQWGLPFKVIYETFRTKIRSWLALMNIYLLVDAIDVGGGTSETLETVTHFGEGLYSLEKEKKEALRPLVLMPYIGAGILLFSTIILLGFNSNILSNMGHQAIPLSQVVTIILPTLIVQVFFVGLVTGKICTGEIAAGFKHAAILTIIGIALLPIVNLISIPFRTGA